jgi:hypothetical protein
MIMMVEVAAVGNDRENAVGAGGSRVTGDGGCWQWGGVVVKNKKHQCHLTFKYCCCCRH